MALAAGLASAPSVAIASSGSTHARAQPVEPAPLEPDAPAPGAPGEGVPQGVAPPPTQPAVSGLAPRKAERRTEVEPTTEEETRVVRVRVPPQNEERAATVVTREQIEERLPRSAPDALRGEPGVYVQQTGHGQGSPYVRGLTGQQTVIYFDGVRLNNSTFRQGPNQYFFTIDSRTVDRLEVLRGSASTRYGSDAIGGALLSTPIQPSMARGPKPVVVHPRAMMRTTSADSEIGGRGQVDVSWRGKVGVLGGVGYRDVGLLRSGGRVIAPQTGMPQNVPPRFGPDGKTQLGTGFRELTADTRVVWRPRRRHRFTLGYYDYRQFDAPRTDKCPPPTAPEDECLTYLQQFRTLVYGAFEDHSGSAAADTIRLTVSYQNQHERRQLDRGSPSPTQVHGDDDVHTSGTGLKIATRRFTPAPWLSVQGRYGADLYYDRIRSEEWLHFTDSQVRSDLTRGQYLDDANYLTSGVFAEAEVDFDEQLSLRAGGRAALAHADAPGDPTTESAAVRRTWGAAVGNAGVTGHATDWLSLVVNLDQGFRAPNLDDLTSRQQTGPGFQFENPDLDPERSLSLEAGLRIEHPWIEVQGWVFQTRLRDLIARAPRTVDECPMGDTGCSASQTRFQLVNLDGPALLRGAEADVRFYFPLGFRARGTVSYAWGEGPNPIAQTDPAASRRDPLSRVPPLNGIGELGWRGRKIGLYAFGVVRWARAQTRLALADRSDARIPLGGTPGYVVFDLRAGYRLDPHVLLGLVFENVADTAYRHHGSSINGPGRGVIAQLEIGW